MARKKEELKKGATLVKMEVMRGEKKHPYPADMRGV